MRRVNNVHGCAINLEPWVLPETEKMLDGLRKAVLKAASEALTLAVENDVALTFPAVWGESDGLGNPSVTDPLTLYLYLPLGPEQHSDAPFATSLSEILLEDLQDATHPEDLPPYARISAALRELADRIDAELALKAADHRA